jgi:PAS domain S-box-containing protein
MTWDNHPAILSSNDKIQSVLDWAFRPILEDVLASGASAVRLVIAPENRGADLSAVSFGLGPASQQYQHLDEALMELCREQPQIDLEHPFQELMPGLRAEQALPGSLKAIALHHEHEYQGLLWAAYEHPRVSKSVTPDPLFELAEQASVAAANVRLFCRAELGEQRLVAILDSTQDPVLVADQHGIVILANPAARHTLGVPAETTVESLTQHLSTHPELSLLLQGGENATQSREVCLPDGRVFYASASEVLAEGRMLGRVCILRDVTRFKELEALKSDFVSTASHDLRSPLTLIRGYATLLDTVGELNEGQKKYVSKILDGVDGMTHLVNNLLDLGRIEAGVEMMVSAIPLHDFVTSTLEPFQLLASQKGIHLQAEVGDGLPATLEADRGLLSQALHNLVENAIKYTPENGSVTLRVRNWQAGVHFEVEDSGIGVSADDLPRLFDKFFRGHQREARAQRGSGLGLAIVRSIAEQHGGRAWAESVQGQGSVFHLWVPATPSEVNKP